MELKDLTFEVCAQLHKEMWTWLAENHEDDKSMWPRWYWNTNDEEKSVPGIVAECFACYWSEKGMIVAEKLLGECFDLCACCPCCVSGDNRSTRECLGGLFRRWQDSPDGSNEEKELALEIANLPWVDKTPKKVEEVKQNG